ncbi:hypothetical protein [Citrobacter portucalensis]|uniref:hypothetical protein n=1 Tax=Citrobacter portucalensis TaxID=1639133 RepID=UPI0022442F13|nr:hypothetical protein [Citrobacter portucalensis]MCW8352061.1 hypothetical protein [Citrobacter portucalensis]MCX9050862.1 hypothetical protein [Citrobacter portucalensis]
MSSREKFEQAIKARFGDSIDYRVCKNSDGEYMAWDMQVAWWAWQAAETDMAVQLANAESKCRGLAAELSAVDKIHNEAVFITDDHYEQCPPEVQNMIRSLAVLQIPAYQAFLAEVRASARNEGINYAASRLAAAFNHGFIDKPVAEVFDVTRMILSAKEDLANDSLPAADGLSGEYAEKAIEEWAVQLRKGAAL